MHSKGMIVGWGMAAWGAVFLALYSLFVVFKTWVMVPANPQISSQQLLHMRVVITAVSVAMAVGALVVARWAFARRRRALQDMHTRN